MLSGFLPKIDFCDRKIGRKLARSLAFLSRNFYPISVGNIYTKVGVEEHYWRRYSTITWKFD